MKKLILSSYFFICFTLAALADAKFPTYPSVDYSNTDWLKGYHITDDTDFTKNVGAMNIGSRYEWNIFGGGITYFGHTMLNPRGDYNTNDYTISCNGSMIQKVIFNPYDKNKYLVELLDGFKNDDEDYSKALGYYDGSTLQWAIYIPETSNPEKRYDSYTFLSKDRILYTRLYFEEGEYSSDYCYSKLINADTGDKMLNFYYVCNELLYCTPDGNAGFFFSINDSKPDKNALYYFNVQDNICNKIDDNMLQGNEVILSYLYDAAKCIGYFATSYGNIFKVTKGIKNWETQVNKRQFETAYGSNYYNHSYMLMYFGNDGETLNCISTFTNSFGSQFCSYTFDDLEKGTLIAGNGLFDSAPENAVPSFLNDDGSLLLLAGPKEYWIYSVNDTKTIYKSKKITGNDLSIYTTTNGEYLLTVEDSGQYELKKISKGLFGGYSVKDITSGKLAETGFKMIDYNVKNSNDDSFNIMATLRSTDGVPFVQILKLKLSDGSHTVDQAFTPIYNGQTIQSSFYVVSYDKNFVIEYTPLEDDDYNTVNLRWYELDTRNPIGGTNAHHAKFVTTDDGSIYTYLLSNWPGKEGPRNYSNFPESSEAAHDTSLKMTQANVKSCDECRYLAVIKNENINSPVFWKNAYPDVFRKPADLFVSYYGDYAITTPYPTKHFMAGMTAKHLEATEHAGLIAECIMMPLILIPGVGEISGAVSEGTAVAATEVATETAAEVATDTTESSIELADIATDTVDDASEEGEEVTNTETEEIQEVAQDQIETGEDTSADVDQQEGNLQEFQDGDSQEQGVVEEDPQEEGQKNNQPEQEDAQESQQKRSAKTRSMRKWMAFGALVDGTGGAISAAIND